MALTILITGFGPFPGAPFNPTGTIVRKLARLRRPALAGVRLVPHIFETSYRAVDRDLPRLVAGMKPDAILMFGLSNRASCLRVETRARNMLSAFRDAEGRRAGATRIVHGGPAALTFAIPGVKLALAASSARTKAVTSRDAGRYLCNYLSWRAIETAAQPGGPRFVAFIHVPKPWRGTRRPGRSKQWRMADLITGAEAILLATVAETRRRMKQR